ncbi:DUF2799 domain-containing protein [Paludibacterium yongneupense]|uniref:DUF2799 domain-containing protein n=1 Tax=Paludibacterium yongneupense TaxID=400061 RepID=UPI00040ACD9A|nr:DUF2799 domain-containing protein [Paludibacterium yongneupense]
MNKRLLLCLLPALLAGCATMNEQECRSKTPATVGLSDGRQGYGVWRLDKHADSCARFGIGFDRNAYLKARAEGLLSYCTPDNGERAGARGERYEYVCPAALEPAFLARYRPAYRDWLAAQHSRWWWP